MHVCVYIPWYTCTCYACAYVRSTRVRPRVPVGTYTCAGTQVRTRVLSGGAQEMAATKGPVIFKRTCFVWAESLSLFPYAGEVIFTTATFSYAVPRHAFSPTACFQRSSTSTRTSRDAWSLGACTSGLGAVRACLWQEQPPRCRRVHRHRQAHLDVWFQTLHPGSAIRLSKARGRKRSPPP